MEYKCEFGLYREDDGPINRETLNELIDLWVEAVESAGFYTGGGIREYVWVDTVTDWIWAQLWRVSRWVRFAV